MAGPYDVITWILPFVHEAPLRAWGLPRRLFEPGVLLDHVLSLLAPDGLLFIVNQGLAEAATQEHMLRIRSLPFDALGALENPLSPFRKTRFGYRILNRGDRG
jgi:hypothetical protein